MSRGSLLDSVHRASDDMAVHTHSLETAPAESRSATTASPGKAALSSPRFRIAHHTAHRSGSTAYCRFQRVEQEPHKSAAGLPPPFRRSSQVLGRDDCWIAAKEESEDDARCLDSPRLREFVNTGTARYK